MTAQVLFYVFFFFSEKNSHLNAIECDFSETRAKKGKIFENLVKSVQNVKIF